MESKKDFLDIMNSVALVYDREFSKAVLDMYWLLLREENYSEFKCAMQRICQTSKFWPKPSEIISEILKGRGPVVGIEARAEQQWRVVISAVRDGGMGREPIFMDSTTSWIIKNQIKWSYLCEILQADEKWEQKRFCRSYELIAKNPDLLRIEGGAGNAVKKLTDGMLKGAE